MTDIAPGWPCALLPAIPPSVADRLSAPTADDILPQLLQLTPRGPAWGTDEAGDGQGAGPVMLGVWTAIAGHAAAEYAIDFDLATQCFPSGVTYSLPDWEAEYGLPDTCISGTAGIAQRIAAVRAKFGAVGGQSPAYFVCLAASLGYDITIEEPGQFLCDVGQCIGTGTFEGFFICDSDVCVGEAPIEGFFVCDQDVCVGQPGASQGLTTDPDPTDPEGSLQYVTVPADPNPTSNQGRLDYFVLDTDPYPDDTNDQVSDETVWKFWIVHVGTTGLTFFRPDLGQCDTDPLEGFLPATDLECELRRLCPPHTQLVFDYSALPHVGVFDFSNAMNSDLLALL